MQVVTQFDSIVDEDFEYVNDSIKKLFIVRSDVRERSDLASPSKRKWRDRSKRRNARYSS